jgi:hypothetical protein
MRRLVLVLTIAFLLGTVAAPTARAAPPPDAGDLAADCNADGVLSVTGTLRFRGGTGTLTADCVVTMAPGSTLVLHRVVIDSTCCFFVVGDAQERTTVRVVGSTIDLAGPVQLAPGCCAGSGEPGRSEADGTAIVHNSTIRGQTVEVSGSIADGGGRVVVRGSLLEATDPTFGSVAVLAALSGGTGGRVLVRDSTLIAVSETRIATGASGRTVARNDVFSGPATVTVTRGPGGSCSSVANTPPVPCT